MDTMSCFMYRILFLGAVVCISASANLMMEYNIPEPNGNINRFPHESSCHYYYLMLSEEDITIEKCPDGQLFDYIKHSCIPDKEHVHCWSRHFGKMKHDHTHMKHKKHFKCPYPWGKYPNLHDCSKYHLCLKGKSRVKKCAPYELFDKISRKCIASIDAVCADKTDVVEHGYMCPKTWGSFTFSKDCSKYYECLQRKPTLRTCQKGMLFDDRLRKCAPSEHVYCGLRHNPYEKIISDVPGTPLLPTTTIVQKSTPQEASSTIKEAKSTPQEASSTIKEATSTPQEASSTIKEATSTPQEASSIIKEATSTPQEASSTIKEVTSTPQKGSSTIKEVTSTPQKGSSTIKEVTPTPQEDSSTIKEVTSTPQEISATITDVIPIQASKNQPTSNEVSSPAAVPETDSKESKQESRISTSDPNAIVKSEKQQETSDVTEDVFRKNEFIEVLSTTEKVQVKKIASDEESEVLKKDVSTEEKDTDVESEDLKKDVSTEEKDTSDVSNSGKSPGDNTDSSATTVCLPEDSMCVTEKDGTVVKCSNSKDLQPHPKDERRYLDCTKDKIQIITCQNGLTFHPDAKKCRWQFVMVEKTPEDNTDSPVTTVCLPEDSMCVTEKDGTVVKCSNSKDLQPHPKDERRFLDCTKDKIRIITCPKGSTFHPGTKMCKWQFVMAEKTPGNNTDSSTTTGCLPEDSMCVTEKDGTVVKCSNSKDLQPHPKDARRFLDCTEDKIEIFTCPPGLTFHPDIKKCRR